MTNFLVNMFQIIKIDLKKFQGSLGPMDLHLYLKENYLFVDGRYTLQANKEAGQKFKIITIPKKT